MSGRIKISRRSCNLKLKFTVYGEPCGKGRPRFNRCTGPYTPEKTVSYENLVKLEFKNQCGNQKFDKDVALDLRVVAYFPIPKSTSKIKTKKMLDKIIRPTKKPDADNLLKCAADALNNLAYYDDAQIVDTQIRKFYSDEPRAVITIQEAQLQGESK